MWKKHAVQGQIYSFGNTYLRLKEGNSDISYILHAKKTNTSESWSVSEKSVKASEYVLFTVRVSATPCPSVEGRARATTGYISLISQGTPPVNPSLSLSLPGSTGARLNSPWRDLPYFCSPVKVNFLIEHNLCKQVSCKTNSYLYSCIICYVLYLHFTNVVSLSH